MKPNRPLALLAVSALFTACGGGGSSDPSPPVASAPAPAPAAPAPAPAAAPSAPNDALIVPLATTLNNLMSLNRSTPFKIEGWVILPGHDPYSANPPDQHFYASGTGTLSETVASGTFEGVASLTKTTRLAGTVLGASTPVLVSLTKQEFFDVDHKPLGSVADGNYCVTTSYTPPPAEVGMWKTSMWFMEDCYSGPDKLKKVGIAGTSYTISSETATTAALWVGRRLSYTNGTNLDSATTYSIDSSGNLSPTFSNMSPFKVGEALVNLIPLYQH